MRLLSIDFDYFIDTDYKTRSEIFPDGSDYQSDTEIEKAWEECYKEYPQLKNIGILKEDFEYICSVLSEQDTTKVLVADSHKHIERFFKEVKDKPLELVHIDFHHDMFVTGGNELDCGNWLRFLIDQNPFTDVLWIRREDSDTTSLFGEFPYPNSTNIKDVTGDFDLIFICFSSPWTPPHLKEFFNKMLLHLDFVTLV